MGAYIMFKLNESISFLLSKCHQKAWALAQERLTEYNLTPQQAVALTYLFKKDGINQLELGEMIQKDRTTVSGIVNNLVKSEYLVKKVDQEDRRSSLLYVTKKAHSIEEVIINQVIEVNESLVKDLTEQEQRLLIELLNKVRESQ